MRAIRRHRFILPALLALLLLALALAAGVSRASADQSEEQVRSITDTIYERALQCYVIEGAYPESLSYLEENYGLTVNQEDYRIIYNPFAENLPPEVRVISREGS